MVALPKVTPEEAVRSDLIPDILNMEAKRFAYRLFNEYGKCHRKGVFRDDCRWGVDQIISKISPQHNIL